MQSAQDIAHQIATKHWKAATKKDLVVLAEAVEAGRRSEPEFAPDTEFDPMRQKWENIRRDDLLDLEPGQSGVPFIPDGYEFRIIGIDPLSSEKRQVTVYRTTEQTRRFLAAISEEDRA